MNVRQAPDDAKMDVTPNVWAHTSVEAGEARCSTSGATKG